MLSKPLCLAVIGGWLLGGCDSESKELVHGARKGVYHLVSKKDEGGFFIQEMTDRNMLRQTIHVSEDCDIKSVEDRFGNQVNSFRDQEEDRLMNLIIDIADRSGQTLAEACGGRK